MRITFLGTGTSQGIPVLGCKCYTCSSPFHHDKRLRCSVLIEHKGKHILIDTGPDVRRQLLDHHVTDLEAILYTHEHFDHVAGLDEIRPLCYINNKTYPIYASEKVLTIFSDKLDYIFNGSYAGATKIEQRTIEAYHPFQVADIEFLPLLTMHGSIEVMGFRFHNVAYLTDVKYIPAETLSALQGVETLIITGLENKVHPTHLSLPEAVEFSDTIGAKETYFIHMSHKLGRHLEVQQTLPVGKYLAYDNLVLTV